MNASDTRASVAPRGSSWFLWLRGCFPCRQDAYQPGTAPAKSIGASRASWDHSYTRNRSIRGWNRDGDWRTLPYRRLHTVLPPFGRRESLPSVPPASAEVRAWYAHWPPMGAIAGTISSLGSRRSTGEGVCQWSRKRVWIIKSSRANVNASRRASMTMARYVPRWRECPQSIV